ncbi:ATP-binding cassette domain-containing protein [Dokdonella sp.]|uniref:ATP-binding cassette domain-containing protein n=1 Tax=Dokdonella sp. TaxID=2291710 RepID=UPI0025C3B71B|nr:ATP-binding cassette domain-containing protein [Dokdonella sp.]MBX3688799.1 ATP-binding cassette domain-containing protein [Dokdonella sp.]
MLELNLRHRLGELELDLDLRSQARTLALFGHSGAGKTSVLNAIAGLLAPQSGRIVLDDRVLLDTSAGIDLPVAQRRLGYVFQDGRLFPHMSVRKNLLYGAREQGIRPREFDSIVGLLALDPLLERRPPSLSGGERQRVAIGRALLADPRALLLDEPLSGLHAEARAQVLDHLRTLKRELQVFTVLVSHHADEVAALADEVVQIREGRVLAQLPAAEFASRASTVAQSMS